MRDMRSIYYKHPTEKLKELRSKKIVRLQNLHAEASTFFVRQEIDKVKHQIHQIDVELMARFLQMELPLQ